MEQQEHKSWYVRSAEASWPGKQIVGNGRYAIVAAEVHLFKSKSEAVQWRAKNAPGAKGIPIADPPVPSSRFDWTD